MNDCVFCFICNDDCNCNGCEKYISINTNKGRVIDDEYQRHVMELVNPAHMWLSEIRDGYIKVVEKDDCIIIEDPQE